MGSMALHEDAVYPRPPKSVKAEHSSSTLFSADQSGVQWWGLGVCSGSKT
jgi:hypothetical protein